MLRLNRAPTHAEKKSRFSARFSLSMGSVLSARLLDLMLLDRTLATIFCGSMAAAICASKRRRGCSRKVTFAARLGRRLDGDLRQQEGFFAWRLMRTIRLQGARGR
jgi:hypothetical protein